MRWLLIVIPVLAAVGLVLGSVGCKEDEAELEACLITDECPVGQICFFGYCEADRCESDVDCRDGRICTRTYCRLMEGESCVTPDECASGQCVVGHCAQ